MSDNFWFGSKRFDRGDNGERFHIHSLAGMLHADFRLPSLDYETILKATLVITKDHRELHRAFRLAVFNVIYHNRDDHAKNFSFLMDHKGNWTLSQAYDITFSLGFGGEHSTSILGEGRNPHTSHLLRLAEAVGISLKDAKNIIAEIESGKTKLKELLDEHEIKDHPVFHIFQ